MAGIVRLKRRRDDQPAENLLFSCKKRKTVDESGCGIADVDNTFKTLFKFAGTIDSKGEDLGSVVKKAISKEKLQKSYKQAHLQYGGGEPAGKRRQAKKESACLARFKVVADRRVGDWESLADEKEEAVAEDVKGLFLWDVEDESLKAKDCSPVVDDAVTCNGIPLTKNVVKKPENEYVYDLYYFNKPDFDFRLMEHVLAVEAFGDQRLLKQDSDDDSDVYEDEDDENAEGNWRNDYPDEDPRYYTCDDQDDELAHAMHDKLTFDDGEDLFDGETPSVLSSEIWNPAASYQDYQRNLKAYLRDPF